MIQMRIVKIGCCGFPVSRKKYYEIHSLVELQNTFYNLPTETWAEKLRAEAPEKFEFTVKAWQVITHTSRSPTWRRLRRRPPGRIENYGLLKPTRENLEALEETLKIARRLHANIIVLQTPPSLPFTDEAASWIYRFFAEASVRLNSGELLGWEPRGKWAEAGEVLRRIMCGHGVIHIVDIFKHKPICMPGDTLYVRLHGLGGEVNYRYKYSDDDLRRLATIINETGFRKAYVLFNNIQMLDDSLRFKDILGGMGGDIIVE
jgi:uncharacterized protein YecE (DUF72 family)